MPTPPPKPRQPATMSAADFRALQESGKRAADSYKAARPAQPASPNERLRGVAQRAGDTYQATKAKKASPTNALTQAIIQLLTLRGFTAWRQNNAAVYDASFGGYRAGSTTPGIADIVGYCRRTGRFCAVEVKTGSDRLSDAQRAFLAGIRDAGGFAVEGRSLAQVEADLNSYLLTTPAP